MPPRRAGLRLALRLAVLLGLLLTASLAACAGPRRLRAFATDGCSAFPDQGLGQPTGWRECCVLHDLAYWRGGTWTERREADLALDRCVARLTGSAALAGGMYAGVRVGGSALWPTAFRWGYGWLRDRPYAGLTSLEARLVDEEMERWRRATPGAPEAPWKAGPALAP